MTSIKAVSSYENPSDFIGGCEIKNKAPRTKLRASWLQPKDEEFSLEALLKPSKKPVDFMGGSSSKGLDVYKADKPMEDTTEKTANSSSGDFDHSFGEIAHEAESEQEVTESEMGEEGEATSEPATHGASAYANDDYLPGSEPKPIKRWTPPPKEDPVEPPKRMSRTWDQPDDFLGGCEPAPIKRWTPPPKEASDTAPKRTSATWDQPTQYLGGCEPKAVRRWSRPTTN